MLDVYFYYIYLNPSHTAAGEELIYDTTIRRMKYEESWYGQSMRVQVRQTSAPGAGARLRGYVRYEQL